VGHIADLSREYFEIYRYPKLMKINSCSTLASLLPTVAFIIGGVERSSAATPPVAHDLASAHFEFSDFADGPNDYLVWQGSASTYYVYRAIDHQPETFMAAVSGKSLGLTLAAAQFIAKPIAAPGSIAWYRVYGAAGSRGDWTNYISIQELFPDPGFKAGPTTTAWTQIYTFDEVGVPQPINYIEGDPGNLSAVLGGWTSDTDEIYTTNPIFISDGTRPVKDASLTLSGSCAVTTEESPNETVAYDHLYVEIRAMNGNVLATYPIADNRNSGNTGRVRFNIPLDYHNLYGTTVYVSFKARNDEIYPTTFTLDQVELDLNLIYR